MAKYERFEFASVDGKYDVTVLGCAFSLQEAIKYADLAGANSIAGWGHTNKGTFFITNWAPDGNEGWVVVNTRP